VVRVTGLFLSASKFSLTALVDPGAGKTENQSSRSSARGIEDRAAEGRALKTLDFEIEVIMIAYLVLLLAVLSRILPHAFHSAGVNFTAVGGGLLYFGARRGRWQTIIAVIALMATDYYLTVFAYNYPFHLSGYVVTWAWYAAICLVGHQMLSGKATGLRVAGAVAASATSFFVLSNFMVWAGSTMYPHSAAGLAACYVAAIPFYANDVMSTAVTAGALFGLPVLVKNILESVRESQNNALPLA
jgi:hypothetical protein